MLRRLVFLIALPIILIHSAYAFVGCAGAIEKVEAISDPHDDTKLSDCRKIGREAKADGAAANDAYAKYVDCTKEAGLR